MFALSVIPLLLGHLLASRVVRERHWLLRVVLGYALGLSFFLLGVNALFHAFSLRASVLLTLAVMGAASLALARRPSAPARPLGLGPLEAVAVTVLATTVGFWTLFWQMKNGDQDFYLHGPLMVSFLRDVFPPRNPLFPDMLLEGHYGRDLTIAGLSVLFSGRVFEVQYVVTALNQAAIVLFICLATRRFTRSTRAALLAAVLAALGINTALRYGLLDSFGNNNSFVYLFLFLNMYLFLRAIGRPGLGLTVVAALSMAAYSLVYETHYGILVIVLSLVPFVLAARARRWRACRVGVTAAIVAVSLALSLVQGGTLSAVSRRHLRGQAPGDSDRVETHAAQVVGVHFPKPHFRITSYDGTEYSVLSGRILREAGPFVALLPVVTPLLLVWSCPWGGLIALISIVAIAVPAAVDFGTFNAESFRFMFFAGLAATLASGMAVGLLLDRIARNGRVPWWGRLPVVGLLVVACTGTVRTVLVPQFVDVGRYPEAYYWNADRWACDGATRAICDRLDALAALALRPLTSWQDRILTNVGRKEFRAHTIVTAFAGAPVAGHGLLISPARRFAMGTGYLVPHGFRATAFWHTGDVTLLPAMSVTYLVVDPARLSRPVATSLRHEPGLELIHREDDARRGGSREVYRVRRDGRPPGPSAPDDLSLRAVELPPTMARAGFHAIPFAVRTGDPGFDGRLELGHRILSQGLQANLNDEVRHIVQLRRAGEDEWTGTFFLVAPWEAGTYDLELYAMKGTSRVSVQRAGGGPTTLRINVP
jgi:hypothetical protein